jgi:hypothetical protein
MARMPGATWKPLPRGFGTRMARYDLVVIHTCVGSLTGTDGYFRSGKTSANSHFGTGGYGEIWQWGDTTYRSAANGAGNHRSVTIENADMGAGFPAWNTNDSSQVPAFTAAQLEANAQICAWANKTHGVPLVAADTSRPTARGIGYHRLGCNPYRVADGELWSSSYGKVCPGTRRIAQIPQIITRAKQIAGAAAEPATPVQEDDDMKLIQSTGRGIALVGPGYFRSLSSEEVGVMTRIYGQPAIGNDREFDVARSVASHGGPALDYRPHHGNPEDDLFGHILSIRQKVADGTGPAVDVDAGAVARELAANPGFVESIAEAVGQNVAERFKD